MYAMLNNIPIKPLSIDVKSFMIKAKRKPNAPLNPNLNMVKCYIEKEICSKIRHLHNATN